MIPLSDEWHVRTAAMNFVGDCRDRSGGVVTRAELESFAYDGLPLKLIDTGRGIRNPKNLAATISILSNDKGPYADEVLANGRLKYDYRDGDPAGGDNRKLREAHRLGLPLIYLRTLQPAIFVPTYPVVIAADNPEERFVELDLSGAPLDVPKLEAPMGDARSYAERLTRLRLHQPVFRARVLQAYDRACVMCNLRHVQLLDAAHIVGDSDGGQPQVKNGLALCKIHHAAYDVGIVGIDADSKVHVRTDVMQEVDGPMLKYGLQEVHNTFIRPPIRTVDAPDRDALDSRFQLFLS